MTRLNRRGGDWPNDLQLGRERLISSELYQPLDFEGHWFVAPSREWRRTLSNVFSGSGQEVAELEVRRTTASLDLGYQFGRFGEIRLGLERGAATVDVLAGQLPMEVIEAIEIDDVDVGGVVFEGTYDSLAAAAESPADGSENALHPISIDRRKGRP